MQVSVEVAPGLERRMVVTVLSELIEGKVKDRLKKAAAKFRLDGFRPGKVPSRIIKQRFGNSIRKEVIEEVIRSSYREAVEKESLDPVAPPEIVLRTMGEGQNLEYEASFEIFPEIELQDFSQIEVEKLCAEITASDVENILNALREQHKTWQTVDREARNGDQVSIDFKGFIDDQPFDGGAASNHTLVVGAGNMLSDFEAGIIGMHSREEKRVAVTFPKSYHVDQLCGKQARFDIKLHNVCEAVLPELDEKFYAQFGLKKGDRESFAAEVRKNMGRELARQMKTSLSTQVMEALLNLHEFDIPTRLTKIELQKVKSQSKKHFEDQCSDISEVPESLFEEQARKRVAMSLLSSKIIKDLDLKLDKARVKDMVQEIASVYQNPEQVYDWYFSNEEQLNRVHMAVLEDQLVDAVLEKATVTEKNVSYDEIMRPQPSVSTSQEQQKTTQVQEQKQPAVEQSPKNTQPH